MVCQDTLGTDASKILSILLSRRVLPAPAPPASDLPVIKMARVSPVFGLEGLKIAVILWPTLACLGKSALSQDDDRKTADCILLLGEIPQFAHHNPCPQPVRRAKNQSTFFVVVR